MVEFGIIILLISWIILGAIGYKIYCANTPSRNLGDTFGKILGAPLTILIGGPILLICALIDEKYKICEGCTYNIPQKARICPNCHFRQTS